MSRSKSVQEPAQEPVVVAAVANTEEVFASSLFGSRRPLRATLLRRTLRKWKSKDNRAVVNSALEDDELFEAVLAGVEEDYVSAFATQQTFLDSIESFLKFLVDNQDAILKLITTLIALFGAA